MKPLYIIERHCAQLVHRSHELAKMYTPVGHPVSWGRCSTTPITWVYGISIANGDHKPIYIYNIYINHYKPIYKWGSITLQQKKSIIYGFHARLYVVRVHPLIFSGQHFRYKSLINKANLRYHAFFSLTSYLPHIDIIYVWVCLFFFVFGAEIGKQQRGV